MMMRKCGEWGDYHLRGGEGIIFGYDDPEIVFLYEGHFKGYKKYIKRDGFQSARYGEVNDSECSDGAKRMVCLK